MVRQITPSYKGGHQRERSNYRPISVLPILSKNHRKTCSKLAIKISLREQFAIWTTISLPFWSFRSETALIRITDEILFKMDKDRVSDKHLKKKVGFWTISHQEMSF